MPRPVVFRRRRYERWLRSGFNSPMGYQSRFCGLEKRPSRQAHNLKTACSTHAPATAGMEQKRLAVLISRTTEGAIPSPAIAPAWRRGGPISPDVRGSSPRGATEREAIWRGSVFHTDWDAVRFRGFAPGAGSTRPRNRGALNARQDRWRDPRLDTPLQTGSIPVPRTIIAMHLPSTTTVTRELVEPSGLIHRGASLQSAILW